MAKKIKLINNSSDVVVGTRAADMGIDAIGIVAVNVAVNSSIVFLM